VRPVLDPLQRQSPPSRTLYPRKRASVVTHLANVAACSSTIRRPVSCRRSAIYRANLDFANRWPLLRKVPPRRALYAHRRPSRSRQCRRRSERSRSKRFRAMSAKAVRPVRSPSKRG